MSKNTVVVVGAGTVGLVTALGLARNGFDVTVLERATEVPSGPRDMVYHWCILPTFDDLGLLRDMQDRGVTCSQYTVKHLSTDETVYLDMDVLSDVTSYPFNLHVTQDHMTAILAAALADLPNARVDWGTEVVDVTPDPAGVTLSAQNAVGPLSYRADWVVGADGSRSIVRRSLGLSLAGTTWPQRLISADIRFDLARLGHSTASYVLDSSYGATVAKVHSSGLWRYTIAESRMLAEGQIAERAVDAIRHALHGADPAVQTMTPYRVHERSADRFRVGRVFLVGDAAHLTVSTLAFGMLSGLYDATALVEGLTAVAMQAYDDEVLDRYARYRHRNFWEVTSPRSSSVMEYVFARGDARLLEERMASYRRIAADRDERRAFFEEYLDCQSPSLLAASDDSERWQGIL